MAIKVAVIYLGTQGGGSRQLLNLIKSTHKDDLSIIFYASSNNELLPLLDSSSNRRLRIISMPKNKLRLFFDVYTRRTILGRIKKDLLQNKIDRVYFSMPHPWDLSLSRILMRKNNIEVWRGIHDVRRHPGDIWPTGISIKRFVLNSNKVVCFSNYVRDQLIKYKKPVIQTQLFEVAREVKKTYAKGSILFIGRLKKYKGLTLLAETWPLIQYPNKNLTIAGKGHLPNQLKSMSCLQINKWLTNYEIDNLIRNSHLVVLPYTEASQSGVIAIAQSLSTPVVATPVGGLIDQIDNLQNGVVAKDLSPMALASAIDYALQANWEIVSDANPLTEFLKELQSD